LVDTKATVIDTLRLLTMSMSNGGKLLPSAIRQDITNLLAIHCREIVMGEKSEGETTDGQHVLIEKVFHGSEGYASVLDMFMKVSGVYESAFLELPLENNREGNEHRNGKMHELKSILHCELGSRFILHEGGFNRDALANDKKNTKVQGRRLTEKATVGIANYKHSLAFWKEWLGPNEQFPSGKGLEDGLLYVRQKMYVKLRNEYIASAYCKKVKKLQKEEKHEELRQLQEPEAMTEGEMPLIWTYNGYYAFVLYGPSGLTGKTFSCLMEKTGKKVTIVSRKTTRENAAETKNKERSANVTIGSGSRGLTNQESLAFASLAHSQSRDEARDIREHLIIANSDESNALRQLELLQKMVDRAHERNDEDQCNYLEEEKIALFEDLREIRNRKKRLRERSALLSDKQDSSNKSARVSSVVVRATEDASTLTGASPKPSISSGGTPSSTSSRMVSRENGSSDEEEAEEEDEVTS
jgi:hypothetical protein